MDFTDKFHNDFKNIESKYDSLLCLQVSIENFWNDLILFLNETIKNSQNEMSFGKGNIDLIDRYLLNFRTEVRDYLEKRALGNDVEANNKEKSIIKIAGEIIKFIRQIISNKHNNIPLVNNTNVINNISSNFSYDIPPIHERPYYTLLSSKDADKTIVDKIYSWLKDIANVPVWYDSNNLPPYARIDTELSKAIIQCRSMLLILSKSTVSKEWVRIQYQVGAEQQSRFKEFHIVPLCIDECNLPDFLGNLNSIYLKNNQLDFNTANDLLISLFYNNIGSEFEKREVYISRTWRENEAHLADSVCKKLIIYGFKLVGDSTDQQYFYGKFQERIKSIIASCGGLVAILPDRGNGTTSDPMIEEIEIAMNLNLPCLIIAEPNVQIPEKLSKLSKSIIRLDSNFSNNMENQLLNNGIDKLWYEWKKPILPHEVFFATDFNPEHERRNQIIKEHIQRITSMQCIVGDKITASNVQNYIIDKISNSFVVVADISEGNINTLIEAGIALGARTKLHLVEKSPRKDPPFMFADQQVEFYSNDLELLGIIHRIAYHYRRRVLNYEFNIN